jgi:hypothetical protein
MLTDQAVVLALFVVNVPAENSTLEKRLAACFVSWKTHQDQYATFCVLDEINIWRTLSVG